jgi:hypothetical protein
MNSALPWPLSPAEGSGRLTPTCGTPVPPPAGSTPCSAHPAEGYYADGVWDFSGAPCPGANTARGRDAHSPLGRGDYGRAHFTVSGPVALDWLQNMIQFDEHAAKHVPLVATDFRLERAWTEYDFILAHEMVQAGLQALIDVPTSVADVELLTRVHVRPDGGQSVSVAIAVGIHRTTLRLTSPGVRIGDLDQQGISRGPLAALILLRHVVAALNQMLADLEHEIAIAVDTALDAALDSAQDELLYCRRARRERFIPQPLRRWLQRGRQQPLWGPPTH